jgi:NDP-sugar pyrophosphorylase family protein
MNIIIPMGGIGSRFSTHGYRLPKPLIKIASRPMLVWILSNLQFHANDTLFLALRPSVEVRFGLSRSLREQFPDLNIVVVPIEFETRGAAETLYIVTQHMSASQLDRRTISLDCDTIYFSDALTPFRSLPPGCGCSLFFYDSGSEPIYSYISFESGIVDPGNGSKIAAIVEKVKISTYANTGGYGFASATLLQKYLALALDNGVPSSGEYYTSAVIERMLESGHEFRGIRVPEFSCVGTVPQLHDFLSVLRTSRQGLSPRKTFSFDLHGVLLAPTADGKSVNFTDTVRVARSLSNAGHSIVIQATTVYEDALALVNDMQIDCAAVVGEQPAADLHIGSVVVDAFDNVECEIGWLCENS